MESNKELNKKNHIISENKNTNDQSASVSVNCKINGALTVGINPSEAAIVNGESQKLTAAVTGGSGSYTYEWYEGSAAEKLNAESVSEITVAPTKQTTYRVVVNDTIENKQAEATITVLYKYTITFDTDGGSEISPITEVEGRKIAAPANPTKEGYTFEGWSPAFPEIMPSKDLTLKAQWKQKVVVYEIIDGDNSEHRLSTNGTITIRCAGEFAKFKGLQMDGKDISKEDYTAKEGSTIVTLKASYLNKLSAGKHTLTFLYTDGFGEATIKILKAENPSPENPAPNQPTDPNKPGDSSPTAPKTGDDFDLTRYLLMMIFGIAGMTGCVVYKKKRKKE